MNKNFTLRFIQIAWVVETIGVIIFSMFAIVFLKADKITLWHQYLPLISGLILAQGTAAGVGPIAADRIKAKGVKSE
jgi:hypothetical protein